MKIRTIVVDDEPLALRQMSSYVEKTPFWELVAAAHSALEASEILAREAVDVMFIDINMPDLTGIDFVRSLTVRPMVVFTTAYSEFAVDGFRVDALDYLLKPISYADFLRSAQKVHSQHQLLSATADSTLPDRDERIFVRSEYKVVPIRIDEILYIESRSEYVRIYIEGAKPIMTLGSLRSYEQRLSGRGFLRTHRGYLINTDRISMIERRHLIIETQGGTPRETQGGTPRETLRVPIGESYESSVKQWIDRYFFDGRSTTLPPDTEQ